MTSSRRESDGAHAGMLDVENLAVDERTVGLRVRSRELYRPGRGSGILITYCPRLHGSDLRAGWLRFTHNASELVCLDRLTAAGGPQRLFAARATVRRVALTSADHDARGNLGAFAAAPERADATAALRDDPPTAWRLAAHSAEVGGLRLRNGSRPFQGAPTANAPLTRGPRVDASTQTEPERGLTMPRTRNERVATAHDDAAINRLWSVQEVAEFLGIPVSTLHQWRYLGTGPDAYLVGRHLRYNPAVVRSWLENDCRRDVRA